MSAAGINVTVCATYWVLVGFTVDANSSGEAYRWTNASASVQIVSGSNEVSDGSDLVAIEQALQTWSNVDCSGFAFNQVPTTPQVEVDFVSTDWPGYLDGALGVTLRERAGVTYLSGSIKLNDQDFPFGTLGEANVYDIESIAVHELGHVLGLEHTPHPAATMHYRGGRTHTFFRNLDDDDVTGACYLYPVLAFTCSVDNDCPVLMVNRGATTINTYCNGGSCSAGRTEYGHACYVDGDCLNSLCASHPDVPNAPATVPNPGFCAAACDTIACPTGSFCSDALTLAVGPVCFIGADGCIEDSDCPTAMGTNAVCDRDLDGWFRCVAFCVNDADCDFLSGASCVGSDPGVAAGRCRVPGNKARGVPCENALECQSLICGGGSPSYCCDGNDCTAAVMPQDGGPIDNRGNAMVGGCSTTPSPLLSVCVLGNTLLWWRRRRRRMAA